MKPAAPVTTANGRRLLTGKDVFSLDMLFVPPLRLFLRLVLEERSDSDFAGVSVFRQVLYDALVTAAVPNAEADPSDLDAPARGRARLLRRRLKAGAQIGAGLLLFGIVSLAVSRDWRHVHATLSRIAAWELVVSGLLVLVGLGASVLV